MVMRGHYVELLSRIQTKAHGHEVQPITTGFQWMAYGQRGRRYGKARTKELALLDAIKAEVELT